MDGRAHLHEDSGEYLRTAFLGDMEVLISKTVQRRDETHQNQADQP
jgi:hypothetical protein